MKVILFFALAHLALAFVTGTAAYGWDLDQVASRSSFSQAAEPVHKILMFPHDAILHTLLNASPRWSEAVIWGALIGSSLLWGLALFALRVLGRKHAVTRN